MVYIVNLPMVMTLSRRNIQDMRLLWTLISLLFVLNEVGRSRANQIWKENEAAEETYRPENIEALQLNNEIW